jgi:radical SAM protein with 4Fe4S-binding SPASM domain
METARRAIDFFAANLGPCDGYARIDFGLSGEPMLRRNLHSTLHGWIEAALAGTSVSIAWAGPMVTNATLALNDQQLLESLGPPQDISCDGPPEVHDAFRPYTGGRGSYHDIRRVTDAVLARHPDMGVSAVLTARYDRFDQIFLHLYEEMGFRSIYMKPVNVAHTVDYGLNASTLKCFMDGYERLVDLFLAQAPEKRLSYLLALSPDDFFMRYFYRLRDRSRQVYRCGAGKSGAYVDTNGKLYPCAHFIGKPGWDIGHIDTGFDESKRRRFIEAHVDTREPCKSCWARYICGGGCYYQAVLANGDMDTPDLVKCDLIRFIATQAIRLLERLDAETPEVLEALPAPLFISSADVDTPPEALYKPQGHFSALAPTEGAYQIVKRNAERCLLDPRANGSISVEHSSGSLQVRFTPNEWLRWKAIQIWFIDLIRDSPRFRDLALIKSSIMGKLIVLARAGGAPQYLVRGNERVRRVPYIPEQWQILEGARVTRGWQTVEVMLPLNAVFGREMADVNQDYGLNIFVELEGGGRMSLSRYEPFLLINAGENGPLAPLGPEFDSRPVSSEKINPDPPRGMIPLVRWNGLQGNVC